MVGVEPGEVCARLSHPKEVAERFPTIPKRHQDKNWKFCFSSLPSASQYKYRRRKLLKLLISERIGGHLVYFLKRNLFQPGFRCNIAPVFIMISAQFSDFSKGLLKARPYCTKPVLCNNSLLHKTVLSNKPASRGGLIALLPENIARWRKWVLELH